MSLCEEEKTSANNKLFPKIQKFLFYFQLGLVRCFKKQTRLFIWACGARRADGTDGLYFWKWKFIWICDWLGADRNEPEQKENSRKIELWKWRNNGNRSKTIWQTLRSHTVGHAMLRWASTHPPEIWYFVNAFGPFRGNDFLMHLPVKQQSECAESRVEFVKRYFENISKYD